MKLLGVGKFIKQNTGGKIIIPEPSFYEIKALDLEMTRIEVYEDPSLQQEKDYATAQSKR